MEKRDSLGLQGQFTLVAKHDDGEVFATREIVNLIMDAGEDEVAQMIIGAASDKFTWIAVGTSTTEPDDAQTALIAESTTNGGARKEDETPEATANVATIAVTFTFTDALALTEVGLLNASSAGDMMSRQIFDVINVGEDDSLTATWNIRTGVWPRT